MIDERSNPRGDCGVSVVDSTDRLTHVLRLTRKELHERTFLAIASRREVGKAYEASTGQRKLFECLSTR